ncbi:MAG: SigB/SigF/SigG family RNA polymerase sigma factor [Solirubrobacteraceae bacterium]
MASATSGMGGGRQHRTREEQALFERLAMDGDSRDRDLLIERYLPMARSLALRYRRSGEPLDDVLQVAAIGLIKAVDGFDPARGIAFSAYAVPTILGEIKRYFRDRTWAVSVPRDMQELSLRVDRAVGRLAEQLARQPSVAEITMAVGASEEDVLEALQAGGAYRALSFDEPRGGDDEQAATLADSIGVPEHGFGSVEARATFDALLEMVTVREREVLRMRFEQDMAQAEIGAAIGVSQMQVSRIIRKALARLRFATDNAA